MFKLLFLKKLYDLSDEALISSAQTDMAYKFFLDLEPEAKMIDPSLLTKFRKTRITEDILEEMLKEKNINATVVDMYTIKPLDTGLLDTIFSTHRLVVTVEEHNIIGGLGSSIAEYKCDNNLHARLVRIGVNDRFGELGSLRYIWKQHGLTAEQIASKIEFLLK